MLNVLKTTSVMASWARTCTPGLGMRRHHSQHMSLTITVPAIRAIDGMDNSTTVWSPLVIRLTEVKPTWKNDVTIMTENISTLRGSRRRREIGKRLRSCRRIIIVVIQMMTVLRKSRTPSTKPASMDMELVRTMMATLEARSKTFATKLIRMARLIKCSSFSGDMLP